MLTDCVRIELKGAKWLRWSRVLWSRYKSAIRASTEQAALHGRAASINQRRRARERFRNFDRGLRPVSQGT
jgi:hypothetical protein